MKRVFFDANVLLDLLDEKRKGHRDARLLKDAIQETRARSSCSWHTLSILDYIGAKEFGKKNTWKIIREIIRVFSIPKTGGAEALKAFEFLDGDYEDAMQIAAAVAESADYLVTSDSAGFAKSPVEVLTARKCAARLRPAPRH